MNTSENEWSRVLEISNDYFDRIHLSQQSSNYKIYFKAKGVDVNSEDSVQNVWTFITVIRTDTKLQLYHNGNLQNSTTHSKSPTSGVNSLYIGHQGGGTRLWLLIFVYTDGG